MPHGHVATDVITGESRPALDRPFTPERAASDGEGPKFMKKIIVGLALTSAAFFAGWAIGSVLPFPLWPSSECHQLGGSIRTIGGPGKPTECVIPWDEY
jgi:hypothetical protein